MNIGRALKFILLFLSFTLLLNTSVQAAWPWPFGSSEETSYETRQEYDFPACAAYATTSEESFDIACSIANYSSEQSSAKQLVRNGQKVATELHKSFLLEDMRNFVLKNLERKLTHQRDIRNCFSLLAARHTGLSEWCHNTAQTMKDQARELYPQMRLHMALKKPIATLSVGEEPKFEYERYLAHERGAKGLEPISEAEVPAIQAQFDEETRTYRQEWFERHQDKGCVIKKSDGLYDFANDRCPQLHRIMINDYISSTRQTHTKNHEDHYKRILGDHPHFAFMTMAEIPGNENVFNLKMSHAIDDLLNQGLDEYEKLRNTPVEDTHFLMRYPEIINSYLADRGADQVSCEGLQQLHDKYGAGGWYDLATDLGLASAAIIGGGACLLTSGMACAVLVAVGSEGVFIGRDQVKLDEGVSLFQAGLISDNYLDELESARNFSLAMAPLSFMKFDKLEGAASSFAKRHLSRVALRDMGHWLHYVATSPLQNRSWIRVARSSNANIYFDVENAALKRLNDSLGDKNLVTAVTNMHKHLLFSEVDELLAKYPGVKIERYSDFKSSRFAFTFRDGKVPAGFQAELDEVLKKVAKDFDDAVSKMPGISLDGEVPHLWFSAGVGPSADAAGLASRQARNAIRHNPGVRSFDEVSGILEGTKSQIESARNSLVQSFSAGSKAKLLTTTSEGVSVPSLEVFEVMRKARGKSSAELQELFKKRFNVDLSEAEVATLSKYTSEVDQFSPGLWIEERVLANLDEAEMGGFSADFKGMGAKNIQQVAIDLATPGKSLSETVDLLRQGEAKVTAGFDRAKSSYQELIARELKAMGVQVTNKCSGDDCVSLPAQALSHAQQEQILSRIAKSGNPDGYRLSFIPPGIAAKDRTNLAVHGELIEKEVRAMLTGFGQGKIAPEVMQDLAIGVRMPTKVGTGKVELILASGSQSAVAPEVRAQISEALSLATAKVNQDLAQEVGGSYQYQSAY